MVNGFVAHRIATHLKQLYSSSKNGKNGWLKLQVIESETGVSRQTLSRILNGKTNRLYYRTAMNLADYIEKETDGEVLADYLLNESNKNYAGADLKGTDFSGEDLEGADLTGADLRGAKLFKTNLKYATLYRAKLRGAELSHLKLDHTDFCGAILDESHIIETDFAFSNFSVANCIGVHLENTTLSRARLLGTNFTDATFHKVVWDTTGSRTRGIRLPAFDPSELELGFACNDAVAKLIMWEFPGDLEMQMFAESAIARQMDCYDGGLSRMEEALPHRIEDLENAFAKYNDTWTLLDRWNLHKLLKKCSTVEETEGLKSLPVYQKHPWPVDGKIKQLKALEGNTTWQPA
ncbi:MAG: pentapeptide repeat-containing protein [Gemmatimonadetes bacterium]|nr:pentapeptide repeat-containing protein [Gemmatimonadota bacterium]